MKNFESFLSSLFNEYLVYREGLGYSIRLLRYDLRVFDKYLKKTNAAWDSMQPFFFLEMRANIEMEPRGVNKVLSSVRGFFNFLLRREYVAKNPLKDIPLLKKRVVVPFIFSPDQTDQLLQAVCKGMRKWESCFLKDLARYLALLLLARCGLRISEPLRLQHHHYRPDDVTIYIEKTKFSKDRLIPIPKPVATEIENYLSVRKRLCPTDQNPYLLAGRKQKPLSVFQVRYAFHQALKVIGINQPRRVIGNTNFSQPTPHSLRHSFAVNTLKQIKARGESPQHALPVLAAYMGHCRYEHTTVYLKVADALSRKNLYDFSIWQEF